MGLLHQHADRAGGDAAGVAAASPTRSRGSAPARLPPGRRRPARRPHAYDRAGVGLLGAAIVVFLLPQVNGKQWKGRKKWLLAPAPVRLPPPFVPGEFGSPRRHKEPLVDLGLYRMRSWSFGSSL